MVLIGLTVPIASAQPVNIDAPSPGEISINSPYNVKFSFTSPNGRTAFLESMRNGVAIGFEKGPHKIRLEKFKALRFRSAQKIDDWTVVIVEKQSDDCPVQWEIVGLQDLQIETWSFGNCRDFLQVQLNAHYIDFTVGTGNQKKEARFTAGYFYAPDENVPDTPKLSANQNQLPAEQESLSSAVSKSQGNPKINKLDIKDSNKKPKSPTVLKID
jgi:hypothetical protein